MRNRFDRQLVQLNNELIEMGGMIEKAISDTVKALVNQDIELASNVIEYDEEIDHQEREIEQLCLKLLLQLCEEAGALVVADRFCLIIRNVRLNSYVLSYYYSSSRLQRIYDLYQQH